MQLHTLKVIKFTLVGSMFLYFKMDEVEALLDLLGHLNYPVRLST